MIRLLNTLVVALVMIFIIGCHTAYNVHRAPQKKLEQEGTIIFVRPTEYSLFGTKSLRDYLEVTYERTQLNEAGLLEVQVGLRNRGGQHFWDLAGPNYNLHVKTTFYNAPHLEAGAPVYETNWQSVPMVRGNITHYKAICPIASATHYQITISEPIK